MNIPFNTILPSTSRSPKLFSFHRSYKTFHDTLPISRRKKTSFFVGQSLWSSSWLGSHWDGFSSYCFGSLLSVSFYQCCTHVPTHGTSSLHCLILTEFLSKSRDYIDSSILTKREIYINRHISHNK